MFPGQTKQAFRWFCAWVYDVARRGPGKKFFHVDELWQWCTDEALPKELALVANTGREEHIELVTCTQHPHLVNEAITGACT